MISRDFFFQTYLIVNAYFVNTKYEVGMIFSMFDCSISGGNLVPVLFLLNCMNWYFLTNILISISSPGNLQDAYSFNKFITPVEKHIV